MLSLPASHYLIPPPGYWWLWDDSEGVAVLPDGRTLVFHRELQAILEALAEDRGLPPLGSILLVLSVARQPDLLMEVREAIARYAVDLGKDRAAMPHTVNRIFHPALETLVKVAVLPESLRGTLSGRLQVLRGVFEGCSSRLAEDRSRAIALEFAAHLPELPHGEHDLSGLTRLLRDLKALEYASRYTADELENRIRTGLARLSPEQATLALPEFSAAGGSLWETLERSSDPELRAVSEVAGQLRAVLRLPRPVFQEEEQPLGGISDIAPRGDPSRLLLSELAWDDLTFASRLAHGEALYLMRETPPASPTQRRLILLDNGILLWGSPRIYATAVALSLVRNALPGSSVELLGFTLQGWRLLELDSVRELRSWWSLQEPIAHGGVALLDHLEVLEAQPGGDLVEIIWVTHPEALREMGPALRTRPWPARSRFFSAVTDGQGHFSLTRHSAAGERPFAKVQLEPPPLLRPASASRVSVP